MGADYHPNSQPIEPKTIICCTRVQQKWEHVACAAEFPAIGKYLDDFCGSVLRAHEGRGMFLGFAPEQCVEPNMTTGRRRRKHQ